jgi:hypothetical protein
MPPRSLLALLPLPIVFAAGALASAHVASQAGARGAQALGLFAELTRVPPARALHEDADVIPTDVPVGSAPIAAPGGIAAPPTHAGHAAKHAKPVPAPVIFVSQKAVLGLAASGARPHGAPAPATAVRPAGLRLMGVAALGIGLLDGDVLTRAVGAPALSTGAVIQAVLAARARHAPVLEGEVWRGDRRYVLRVEQPYLDERRSDATDGEGPRVTPNAGAQSG